MEHYINFFGCLGFVFVEVDLNMFHLYCHFNCCPVMSFSLMYFDFLQTFFSFIYLNVIFSFKKQQNMAKLCEHSAKWRSEHNSILETLIVTCQQYQHFRGDNFGIVLEKEPSASL